MPTINTCTGSEWHTSYGAKGYVFVVEGGQEVHIHQSSAIQKVDEDWIEIQRGKHGRWCEATYDVPNGTILKAFLIGTWRGRPNEGGGEYFIVDEREPVRRATGGSYAGRGGYLEGPIRALTASEVESAGIHIPADHKKYYKGQIAVV